jgi:4a-hydroxytetrahydrobiopterin dehydratase
MSELAEKRCKPCEGGTQPLTRTEAERLMQQLHPAWRLAEDTRSIHREWEFKNFYRTMSFVNGTTSFVRRRWMRSASAVTEVTQVT